MTRALAHCLAFLFLTTLAGSASAIANDELPDRLEGHGGPIKAVAVTPDGKHALTGSFDYTLIYWALKGEGGTVLQRLSGHNGAVNAVSIVPGTAKAVSTGDDGAFALWNLETGELERFIDDKKEKGLGIAVSPNATHAAVARWDRTVRLIDLATGEEIRIEGHRGNVNGVAFSQDGQTLFSASYDGTIRAWDLNGEPEGQVYSHGWGINVISMLPDGRIAFGSLNGTVGVVDPLGEDAVIIGEYERPILSMSVAPDRNIFASGGADGHIRVFDIATLKMIEDYGDPYGPVWAMDFLPDGKSVYRAGLDDFAARWQIDPRKPFEQTTSVFPRRFQVKDSDDPGEIEFKRKCSVCHTLTPDDGNRAGPTLYRILGRKAGSIEGYLYSDAVKNSGIVWTEETIAQLFGDGPDVMVPGTKMPIQRLKATVRLDALLDYLKRESGPESDLGPDGRMKTE